MHCGGVVPGMKISDSHLVARVFRSTGNGKQLTGPETNQQRRQLEKQSKSPAQSNKGSLMAKFPTVLLDLLIKQGLNKSTSPTRVGCGGGYYLFLFSLRFVL